MTEKKPLELTVYQECTNCDELDRHYIADSGIYFWAAENRAHEKRLTDTELAAEYWKQESCVTTVEAMGGTPRRTLAALQTLERFATLPHASDTNYQ
jgi:hypothetical protein